MLECWEEKIAKNLKLLGRIKVLVGPRHFLIFVELNFFKGSIAFAFCFEGGLVCLMVHPGLSLAEWPHFVYTCVYRIAKHFQRACLGCSKQGMLFKNARVNGSVNALQSNENAKQIKSRRRPLFYGPAEIRNFFN